MERTVIDRLQCPYTGTRFGLVDTTGRQSSAVEFGLVTSEAGEYPIVGGVLRLLNDDLRDGLVTLVRQGRYDEALRGALEVPSLMGGATLTDHAWARLTKRLKLDPGVWTAPPGKRRVHRLVTKPDVPFKQMASGTESEWTNWQTYRFSMPTFQPVYPLAHLATGRRSILDFGCGLGHSAFLLSRLAPDADIICADYSFTSMYLARRFLVPTAACICLDGNYPLPFADDYFDLVFSTDALQYIDTKIGLVREFRRVMATAGLVVLAHLHNTLSPRKAGKALTAAGYDALFDGMARRVYPESEVIADYVAKGVLDLEKRWSLDDISHVGGLSLVAANDDAPFVQRSGLIDSYIDAMRHPQVNPAYRARTLEGRTALERAIDEPYVVARTIDGCQVLPREEHTGLPALDSAGILASRDADRPALRELVRRFLVIDLPESYA